MNLKSQIMVAIEQGLSNQEILATIDTTMNYIVKTRVDYNAIAAKPIRCPVLDKPKEGTASRTVYDYLKANCDAKPTEVKRATGIDYGIIYSVRKLFFGHKPRVNPWIAHANALHTVESSELTP
jgi:hypothetical protein